MAASCDSRVPPAKCGRADLPACPSVALSEGGSATARGSAARQSTVTLRSVRCLLFWQDEVMTTRRKHGCTAAKTAGQSAARQRQVFCHF
jgi:hypothetical protein